MFSGTGTGAVKARKKSSRPIQLKLDPVVIVVTGILLIFGLLMVYSASWDYSLVHTDSATHMISRQVIWVLLGLVVIAIATLIDYHVWQKLAVPAMLVTIILLIGVLALGDEVNNATRAFFAGSVQPSEVAKLMIIIYLAVWLYARQDQLLDITIGLIPLGVILGLVGALIFLQPDTSVVLTIFLLGGMMFFLAGGDLRQMGFLLVVTLLSGGALVVLSSTGGNRISSWLAGLRNLYRASDHVQSALEAFAGGGWFGVGIGNSISKLTGLPVAPTDSIYAVIGEETGVFGATVILALYLILMWRGIKIAEKAPDGLGTLLAGGLSFWLGLEAFINMGNLVNVVPFAGNALPFISYGGSSMLVSCLALGILLNISRLSVERRTSEGRRFDAVIDLRRGDRRGRVSRTGRTRRTAR